MEGVLSDSLKNRGMHTSDKVYDDSDFEDIAKLPPTAPHRNVDLAVVHADEEGTIECQQGTTRKLNF